MAKACTTTTRIYRIPDPLVHTHTQAHAYKHTRFKNSRIHPFRSPNRRDAFSQERETERNERTKEKERKKDEKREDLSRERERILLIVWTSFHRLLHVLPIPLKFCHSRDNSIEIVEFIYLFFFVFPR